MRFTEEDEKFMRLALGQAVQALDEGEVPVGCALVSEDGEVLRIDRNQVESTGDISRHAEMVAIGSAGKRALSGARLYVTLEPCPMCAGAIALSGIKRVIFGAFDRKYGCCGSVYRITEDPAFDSYCPADGGLLQAECEMLLHRFFKNLRKTEHGYIKNMKKT